MPAERETNGQVMGYLILRVAHSRALRVRKSGAREYVGSTGVQLYLAASLGVLLLCSYARSNLIRRMISSGVDTWSTTRSIVSPLAECTVSRMLPSGLSTATTEYALWFVVTGVAQLDVIVVIPCLLMRRCVNVALPQGDASLLDERYIKTVR